MHSHAALTLVHAGHSPAARSDPNLSHAAVLAKRPCTRSDYSESSVTSKKSSMDYARAEFQDYIRDVTNTLAAAERK